MARGARLPSGEQLRKYIDMGQSQDSVVVQVRFSFPKDRRAYELLLAEWERYNAVDPNAGISGALKRMILDSGEIAQHEDVLGVHPDTPATVGIVRDLLAHLLADLERRVGKEFSQRVETKLGNRALEAYKPNNDNIDEIDLELLFDLLDEEDD